MDYHGVSLSWTIVDYRGLPWVIMIIMDYHGLWTIPRPLKAKAETTAQRYGAGMAHPTTSWITLDYHGLSKMMDYPGLAWSILDDRGLPWIIKD
jgi:hypothetical protein